MTHNIVTENVNTAEEHNVSLASIAIQKGRTADARHLKWSGDGSTEASLDSDDLDCDWKKSNGDPAPKDLLVAFGESDNRGSYTGFLFLACVIDKVLS
ncbi:unnamed protein product [Sphenostylis stenocarpa]|uniref:Uncharacterized protein n=1 Tax=Sphenostylis stenocarpa TaxID=92480 RepID=A0AA86SJ29_9FABA|nr:unnamed protein product [Sphenostylis stenocarpa]